MKPQPRRPESGPRSKPPSSPRDGEMTARAVLRWRERAGMTREALADLCKKSVSTVERWERGTHEPTVSDIRRMHKRAPGIVSLIFGTAA